MREEDHRFKASLAYIVIPCLKQSIEVSVGVELLLTVRSLPNLCEALELVLWEKIRANMGFGEVTIAVFMMYVLSYLH